MIDKNKTREAIEKASVAYSGNSYDYQEGFKAGINWFLKNLWQPMLDKPEMGSEILVLRDMEVYRKNHFGMDVNKSFVHEFDFHDNWDNYANDSEYKGWLYIENLMNSSKLYPETLEIEKPEPQFKDGDIVTQGVLKGTNVYIIKSCIDEIDNKYNYYARYNIQEKEIVYNDWAHISSTAKVATDSDKQQLFDALAKENKVWNPETKTLEDLPKKCEFKPMNPMDLCLMRDFGETWRLCQFGFMEEVYAKDYNAVGGNWYNECIPYNEQTAHLLGTTDDWKGGEE